MTISVFIIKNLVTSDTDRFHVMIKVDSKTFKELRLTHDNTDTENYSENCSMQLRGDNFSFHDKNLVPSNTDNFSVMIKGDSRKFKELRLLI